jgi:hypothetical protein
MSEVKKCPECGKDMERETLDVLFGMHIIRKEDSRILAGDKVFPYYCTSCDYIELYKETKGRNKP